MNNNKAPGMRSLHQVYVLFAIYCLYTIPTSSGCLRNNLAGQKRQWLKPHECVAYLSENVDDAGMIRYTHLHDISVKNCGYALLYKAYSDDLPSSERMALCCSQQSSRTNQPEEHIQDLYKRFLFHYAKNKDTRVPQGSGSLSVHPLMHMARKLTGRRKKRVYDASSERIWKSS